MASRRCSRRCTARGNRPWCGTGSCCPSPTSRSGAQSPWPCGVSPASSSARPPARGSRRCILAWFWAPDSPAVPSAPWLTFASAFWKPTFSREPRCQGDASLKPQESEAQTKKQEPVVPCAEWPRSREAPRGAPVAACGPVSWAGRSRCFSLALVTCCVSLSWANAEVSEDPVPAPNTLAAKRGWPLPSAFPRQTAEPRSGERPGRAAWLCAGCAGTRPGKPCVRGGPAGRGLQLPGRSLWLKGPDPDRRQLPPSPGPLLLRLWGAPPVLPLSAGLCRGRSPGEGKNPREHRNRSPQACRLVPLTGRPASRTL